MCSQPAPTSTFIDSQIISEAIAQSQPILGISSEEEGAEVEEAPRKKPKMNEQMLEALMLKVSTTVAEHTGTRLITAQDERFEELNGNLRGISDRLTSMDGKIAG